MAGTVWHKEVLRKEDSDPRRHRSRCKKFVKPCNCTLLTNCMGSAHCPHYREKQN